MFGRAGHFRRVCVPLPHRAEAVLPVDGTERHRQITPGHGSSIRRGRLKNVPLKAMLTPNNISWTIETILQELSKEHEYFHKKR